MAGIPIKGTARGTPALAFTKAKARGTKRHDFTEEYLVALYADADTRGSFVPQLYQISQNNAGKGGT